MTRFDRIRSVLLAMLALVFVAGFSRPAHAGALRVRDQTRVLSADDAARLRSIVAGAPFDAQVVVTTEYPYAADLSRCVGSLVTEPDAIAVGLDPQHHRVQVHFGVGARIARADWPAIERAGNDEFRRGDWEGGLAAILLAAERAAGGQSTDAAPLVSPRAAGRSLVGPGTILLVAAVAIGVGVLFAMRRRAYGPPDDPYRAGPFGAPGYPPGPGPGGYGYDPAMGPRMGPLGGGLIGAGLGGLAGYELGKLEGEREQREREPGWAGRDVAPAQADDGSFDAGGGGSSWDDDGGGGGFDGGDGGGSDF